MPRNPTPRDNQGTLFIEYVSAALDARNDRELSMILYLSASTICRLRTGLLKASPEILVRAWEASGKRLTLEDLMEKAGVDTFLTGDTRESRFTRKDVGAVSALPVQGISRGKRRGEVPFHSQGIDPKGS